MLDRSIADQGRFQAMNILTSLSRLAHLVHLVWTPEQRTLVSRLRALIVRFEDTRDLRLMGGYQTGSDPELDQAVTLVPRLYEIMSQSPTSPASVDAFQELAEALQALK